MVSIVIPTYKRAEFIDRAIKSILEQTYTNYEIIVVDDNDSNTVYREELEKKMEKYKDNSKIIYVKHEKNKNGAAARNTGINIAKGEYITFLDDDDVFMPKRLETLVNALDNNIQYGGAYSSVIILKGKKIFANIEAKDSGNKKRELLLDDFSFGTGSNMFIRANVLKKMNGFDESFLRHQDLEVMIRFFRENKILAVKEPLVIKIEDDRSNEPNVEKYLQVKEHFFKVFENDIQQLGNVANEVYKRHYMMVLKVAIKSKQYKHIKELKQKFSHNFKLTFKDKIKLSVYYINNYIHIDRIKYYYKRNKIYKNISEETKQEINKVLMY